MPDQSSPKPPGDVDSMAPSSRNGRRAPRFSVELEVTLESDHNFYAGLVENLSASGLFIATHALRTIGEQIEFSIRLGESEDVLKGVGVVRWIRQYSESSDTPPGVGLSFAEIEETSRRRILEFLRTREPLFFDDEP
jgi:uncharacterized protein (TIGR02266 family)